jgi:hypothetical protein
MDGDLFCVLLPGSCQDWGGEWGEATVFEWQINGLNFLTVNTVSFYYQELI